MAEGDAGRESPFMMGAGARGMGLGRAFVALSGDASAAFWNPSATAALERGEVMAFHTSLFLETNYDCFALAYPLDRIGTFSLSMGRLGTDNIVRRDINNLSDGTFSSSETQFGVSYGRDMAFGISGGITVKAANSRIDQSSGTGYGADLGFQYHPGYAPGLALALAFNDIVRPGIKLNQVEDRYQTVSRFGTSYKRNLKGKFAAMIATEVASSAGKDPAIRAGIESSFFDQFFLRLGFNDSRISFGAGMVYNFVKLDYAFENIEAFGASHRISLGFTFGKSIKKSREDARASIIEQERRRLLGTIKEQRIIDSQIARTTGDSLMTLGDYHGALGYYQKALALDSTNSSAASMSDSAISMIVEKAVVSSGDERRQGIISARMGSAMDDYRNHYYNEALSKLNLLLEIDPGNQSILDMISTVEDSRRKEIRDLTANAARYQDRGEYAAAISEWNRVLALDRNNNEATRRIKESNDQIAADKLVADAVAAIKNRQYNQAERGLNEALKIRPDDSAIKSLLSEARSKSAPATNLENIKSVSGDWEKYLSGLESFQTGDYGGALRIWEELKTKYPNNIELDHNIDQARQRLAAEGGR